MRLFLLRHAHARDTWPDEKRELSARGSEQITKMCSTLQPSIFSEIVEIWHSPLSRAFQTAESFKKCLKLSAPLVETACLKPSSSPHEIAKSVSLIAPFDKDIMVVGHNPNLESFADLLLGCKDSSCKTIFHKASMAMFIMNEKPSHLHPYGIWSLVFLVSPSALSD